jgi:hypothetical protein
MILFLLLVFAIGLAFLVPPIGIVLAFCAAIWLISNIGIVWWAVGVVIGLAALIAVIGARK